MRVSALSRDSSAASPPATQSACACAMGRVTSGESFASMPLARRPGALAPFRFPRVKSPGSAATLDASSSGTGIDSTVPPAASNSCACIGPPRSAPRRATSRPSRSPGPPALKAQSGEVHRGRCR
eukprot:6192144-Pleurochrysis_carterae.AAC.1